MDKKNCVKGYNCKSACIEKRDKCISEMSPETIAVAEQYLKIIRDQNADFEGLSRGQKSVRTKLQAKFNSADHAAKYLEYHDKMKEIETLQDDEAIDKKLKELEETPWSANPIYSIFDGGKLANEEAYKEKRKKADQIAAYLQKNLTAGEYSKIAEKGQPCGRAPDKRPAWCSTKGAERKAALNERGHAILSNYLMFDFKDPITGEIESWRDIQPDHVITQSKAGAKADTSTNLNMVYGAYNQVKKAGEWDKVRSSLEKVTTKEGFEANMKAGDAKAQKKTKDQQKHYDNLKIIKETDDKETKLNYLNDSTKSSDDAANFLRGLASARADKPPSEYQAPRPFREKSRGSSSWGGKESLTYISKKLMGLDSEITDKEKARFQKDIATSNEIRKKKPDMEEITEELILSRY